MIDRPDAPQWIYLLTLLQNAISKSEAEATSCHNGHRGGPRREDGLLALASQWSVLSYVLCRPKRDEEGAITLTNS